jgi:hypothetical protein
VTWAIVTPRDFSIVPDDATISAGRRDQVCVAALGSDN